MSPILADSPAIALQQSSIPALRKLVVEETDQNLVLTGTVPSFYLKQLAQETVMPHLDGRQLINHVQVKS